MICPIIRNEITKEDCSTVVVQSYQDGKDKKAQMPNKFKRIIGWKAICKQCKFHEKP